MMSIKDLEDELFEEWIKKRGGEQFIKDGVTDSNSFISSSPRILFLLKEANKHSKDEDRDLTDTGLDLRIFLRNGARPATWDNATRWIRGIRSVWNQPDHSPGWKENKSVNKDIRRDFLQEIGMMNLKKTPGTNVAVNKNLERVAIEDQELIRRQFAIYKNFVDVVISCGSVVTRLASTVLINEIQWSNTLYTDRGIEYYRIRNGGILIDYSHPEARVSESLLFYGLIDAIREIRKRDLD